MYEDLDETECRLIREDGREWSVRDLALSGHPLRARVVEADARGYGKADEKEIVLEHGDSLEWRRTDGSVAWAGRIPVTADDHAPDSDWARAAGARKTA